MITEILEKVSTSLLVDVFFAKGLKSEKRRPAREEVFPQLVKLIENDSLKQFVFLMQKKELKEWAKKIRKHVLEARKNNANSCAVMRKRLFEQLRDNGLDEYMQKLNPSERLLRKTLKDMGVETKKSEGGEELSNKLTSEIQMVGIESFLKNSFTVSQLKEIAEDQKINAQTFSPNILTECIITGKDYIPEKKIVKKKKPGPEKDKEEELDPLLDGTTFEERAPWKLIDRIEYHFSKEDSSDDEKDWVDEEKLKDIPYVDEAPEVVEEKTRKRDERLATLTVDYTTIVEAEEVKKKKKKKKKDGKDEDDDDENEEESDPEYVPKSKKRKHREDEEDRKERKKRRKEEKKKHKEHKEEKEEKKRRKEEKKKKEKEQQDNQEKDDKDDKDDEEEENKRKERRKEEKKKKEKEQQDKDDEEEETKKQKEKEKADVEDEEERKQRRKEEKKKKLKEQLKKELEEEEANERRKEEKKKLKDQKEQKDKDVQDEEEKKKKEKEKKKRQ